MWMSVSAKNLALDTVLDAVTHMSVHSAVPDDTGSNEISGGSPAYARKAVDWDAAASGSKSKDITDPVFDIPAGTTCYFYGLWTAVTAGSFRGFAPIAGGSVKGVATVEADDDIFRSKGHGLVENDYVYIRTIAGESLPTGLSATQIYRVIAGNLTTDTFQLSTSQGGSAQLVTTDGEFFFQRIIPETFGSQGTLTCDDADFDLNG